MNHRKYRPIVCALALAGTLGWGVFPVHADDESKTGKVFVIAMENHNWTQPASVTSPQQISGNPAAPFINSLVNGTSGISDQVAYATNYINAGIHLGLHVHPSEPNYVWAEAGQAFNTIGTDDDPYFPGPTPAACTPDTVTTSGLHLTAFLARAHKTWRSYQEDANVDLTNNVPLPMASWTFPLFSHSGRFTTGLNTWNYSTQYNYASKHNPMIFFRDTNGGCPATASTLYPPLQQLALDLQDNQVADYNWITPNQHNDQHSALAAGFGVFTPASDQSSIAQGDNFLARIVPLIMASDAYRNGGLIVLWWDESEGGDTLSEKLPFIVISRDAHKNEGGKPYASSFEFSHSSFLRTMQEILRVGPSNGFQWLGDAANAIDLSDLFKPGSMK
jgi:phosphatidylinositol-3-phosphatase